MTGVNLAYIIKSLINYNCLIKVISKCINKHSVIIMKIENTYIDKKWNITSNKIGNVSNKLFFNNAKESILPADHISWNRSGSWISFK